jgi:large subunit ribosomal protein L17
MKHGNKNRTLGRTRSQRTGLLRGLAVSLIRDERITTTEAKAKELRPFIERMVTFGKQNTVAARRNVASRLGEPETTIVSKVFDTLAPRFSSRAGGYTRIIKMGRTKAGRDEAVIEFVE